jgi:hypothetical protein
VAILTREDLEELRQLLEDHAVALAVETAGPGEVPAAVLDDLVARGIITRETADGLSTDWYHDALLYGMVTQKAAQLGEDADSWTVAETKAWLKKNPLPLGPAERAAVEHARAAAAIRCVGLGRSLADDWSVAVLEEDDDLRMERIGQLQDATATAIAERETAGKLRTRMGEATGDWARDLARIAETELQNCHSHGTAHQVAGDFGGDANVAKIPNPDACDTCRKLYLKPDGTPRIFKLSKLAANGSNVGRKRRDMLPTIDATHPYCHCTLVHVPDGFGFDEEWSLVPVEDL